MKIALCSGISAVLIAIACHGTVLAADTLLVHGHIYTGNPRIPWASALSVTGARIEAVGTDAAIMKQHGSGVQVIDLHGQTVIPGIVDSHTHMLYGAYALHGLNLSTPESSITPEQPNVLIERLKAYAADHPTDAVLFGRADFSTQPPSTPSSALLDRAVSDRPVVINYTAAHALWLNSAALRMVGLSNEPVADDDEERGVIRDASGHPSGVLLEAGMQLAYRAIAARVPLEERLSMVQAAAHYLNSFGVTSVVNATGDLAEIGLYATLRDRGGLTIRTRTSFGGVFVHHHLTPAFLSDLEQARRLYHDDWVSANLVKFFADGGTGLMPPLGYTPRDYEAMVMELDSRGYQIMTHAIRPDSVHMVLDTYEHLEQAHGPRDRRLRIEHAYLVKDPDLSRFARLSVVADMQPTFCCGADGSNIDASDEVQTDRWHTLQHSGAVVAFSSDWPCTWPPSPFVAIQEATTRQVWKSADTANIASGPMDGAAQGGAVATGAIYLPEERMTVADAVHAYTQGSAFAAFSDARVGTLEPGKLADLVVLSQNIFTVPLDTIGQTRVLTTMVGGKVVYSAPP